MTKYRGRVLNNAMLTDCETTLREVCDMLGAEVVEFNGEPDQDLGYPADTGPLSPPAQDPAAGADQDWQRSVYRPPARQATPVQEPHR